MSSILTDLHPDRLYLFAFGPGLGETVLIRVPPDQWIVIDSFRSNDIAAAKLVLDHYQRKASLLILTHPHDDHVCGFVQLVDDSTNATIGCVNLRELANAQGTSNDPLSKFCNNAKKTYDRIYQEQLQTPGRIWSTLRGTEFPFHEGRITSLHPTLPIPSKYLQSTGCNDLSSAMILEWKQLRLLLGADLTNEHGHWTEIANAYPDLSRHVAAKVPHHGSREAMDQSYGNGHRNRCWIATPYNKGGKKLPRFQAGQGVAKILTFIDEILLTALPYRHGAEDQAPLNTTRNIVDSGVPVRSVPPGVSDDMERGIVLGFDADGTIAERRFGIGTLRITE